MVTKDGNLRIQSSLPPEVKGELRCFLTVTVDEIQWQVDQHPQDIEVCLQWWGENGDGTKFWYVCLYGVTLLSSFLFVQLKDLSSHKTLRPKREKIHCYNHPLKLHNVKLLFVLKLVIDR